MTRERVVITGMGVISPVGQDVDSFWQALKTGTSGISYMDTLDTKNLRTKIAGLVRGFDAESYFGRKEARRMDRFCQFAVASADQAIAQSGIALDRIDHERFGVYVGSGIGGIQTLVAQERILAERGPDRVSPMLVPMMISNMAAAQISMKYGALGPTLSPVTACSVGNTAIGEAYRAIQYGTADIIIAGGAEAAITELSLAGFSNATALSSRNDEPTKASRPFDRDRDGFVMAEGAGIVVLEALSHARKRNAVILAEVIGYGASSDAYHMVATHPEGRGALQAMRAALRDAEITAEQLDVISAHATSTEVGDVSETLAMKQLLGQAAYDVPITANKSILGHMLGAAGGAEAIALVKTLQEGIIPPTINLEQADPRCDLDYVANKARESRVKIGMSNSFGFGGHNAVIALKKYEE